MTEVKLAIFLLCSVFIRDTKSACVDKNALSAVNASVHPNKLSKGFKVAANFNLLENYTTIDVYQANVTDLCEGMIKNFPRLEFLSLISVNLSKLQPKAFQKLPRLKELSLAVNKLTEILKGSFDNLPSLEILYLSSNRISSIEENSFADMINLKSVHLDRNELIELNGNLFRGCTKLVLVDFRFNLLEKITKVAFQDLVPTRRDHITILLNRNRITDVDGSAFHNLNPVNLHLEGNRLSTMSDVFHGIKDSSRLYLNKNQFYCIPDDVLENIKNTSKDVYLLNNPISCECLDKIEAVLGEERNGKGEFLYNSSFPCEFAQGISFD